MPSTASAKRYTGKYAIPFLALGYLAYLAYDFSLWNDEGKQAIADRQQQQVQQINDVQHLILGGSNAFYSLSAQQLSHLSQQHWYNLALMHEGYSDRAYKDYIDNIFAPEKRSQVKTIIWSSISPFRSGLIAKRNTYSGPVAGHAALSIKPQRSILRRLQLRLFGNGRAENYPLPSQDGDFDFEQFTCGTIPTTEFIFSRERVDIAAANIVSVMKGFAELFPNAELYVVFPSEYYPDIGYDKIYQHNQRIIAKTQDILTQDEVVLKTKLHFISQPSYPDAQLVCDSLHHGNAQGRTWRTLDLYQQLQYFTNKGNQNDSRNHMAQSR